MSKLAEFRAAEEQLGKQLAALEALRNDVALKLELEFDTKLKRLMEEYGVSRETVAALIGMAPQTEEVKGTGGKRKVINREPAKTFLNPHTGERLTIKRLTHGKYKEWVDKYGAVVVETWRQE